MAGALAERVFVHKMTQVGFSGVEVLDRRPFGLSDAALYPLFAPELIQLTKDLLPAAQQAEVATAVTVSTHKPADTTMQ
ncbi:MAG: hypothetical protein M3O70_24045 [Actinomycetota bacterium]|nr:hypothetical protein [Actinomycetota bacterium]